MDLSTSREHLRVHQPTVLCLWPARMRQVLEAPPMAVIQGARWVEGAGTPYLQRVLARGTPHQVAFATVAKILYVQNGGAMSEQCSENVYRDGGGWGGSPCTRKGVIFEDGKWWCKQHSFSTTRDRRAKSDAREAAERAQRKARWDAEAEQRRRAECFPALLAALEGLLGHVRMNESEYGRDCGHVTRAEAAIKEAKR